VNYYVKVTQESALEILLVGQSCRKWGI